MRSAPTAEQFMEFDRKRPIEHADYLDFAERYADFVAEFEKKDGVIENCRTWPGNDPVRRLERP